MSKMLLIREVIILLLMCIKVMWHPMNIVVLIVMYVDIWGIPDQLPPMNIDDTLAPEELSKDIQS